MQTFCTVVKEGSFTAAASRLGTSKVVVSRHIASLENELGVRLLQRTTRKMSPTDDGLAYYQRSVGLLEEFADLDLSIKNRNKKAQGKLRIAVPSEGVTSRHLLPFFVAFSHTYPQLELDIVLADRYVDIVEEGFDLAVRIGDMADSSLIARKLANMEVLLCASPQYLETHTAITQPADLEQHNAIIDSNYRSGQQYVFSSKEQSITVKLTHKIRINSSLGVTAFLKQGFGVGLCPSFMVSQELETGELIKILPDWHIMSGGIYALYSHRKHLSAKVSVLVDALIEYFKEHGL